LSKNVSFPGDKIAITEEYEAGKNAFDDEHIVRSSIAGIIEVDKQNRLVSVKDRKVISVPQVDDLIIGRVVAVMSSMIAVSIEYINGIPTKSHVECICQTRSYRKKYIALVGDIVKLRISSHRNGAIHATMKEPELGTLFTQCRKCGKKVFQIRDAIKCSECGWIDDRKLSIDFDKSDFLKLRD